MNLLPLLSMGLVLLASPSQAAEPPVDAEAVLRRVAEMTPKEQQQWLREIKARLHRTCDVLLRPDEAAKRKSQYDALLHQTRISRKTLLELVRETDFREKLAAAILQRRDLAQALPSPSDTPVALAASPVALPAHANTVLLAQIAVVSPARAPVISPSDRPVVLPARATAVLPTQVVAASPADASGVSPVFVTPQGPDAPAIRRRGAVDLPDPTASVAPRPPATTVPLERVAPQGLEPSRLPLEHRLLTATLPEPLVQPVSLVPTAGRAAPQPLPIARQPRQLNEIRVAGLSKAAGKTAENLARAALAPPTANTVPSVEVPAAPPPPPSPEPPPIVSAMPPPAVLAEPPRIVSVKPPPVVLTEPPPAPSSEPLPIVSVKPLAKVSAEPLAIVSAKLRPIVSAKPRAVVSPEPPPVVSAELPPKVSAEPPPAASAERLPLPAVEVNVSELGARIGGYNLGLRALEAELDEPRGWDSRQLRPPVDRLTRLVRLRADLAIYCRLVNRRDRPQIVELESPRPVISQLGRSIFEARTRAAGGDFRGSEENRQAELDRLDALSRNLAGLTD